MRLLIALVLAGVLGSACRRPDCRRDCRGSGRGRDSVADCRRGGDAHSSSIARASMPPRDECERSLTDREGRYVFRGVDPGAYRVIGSKPGFARSGICPSARRERQPGERRADLIVALQKGGVIAGRVLDEDGQPMVDVRVMPCRSGSHPGATRDSPDGNDRFRRGRHQRSR